MAWESCDSLEHNAQSWQQQNTFQYKFVCYEFIKESIYHKPNSYVLKMFRLSGASYIVYELANYFLFVHSASLAWWNKYEVREDVLNTLQTRSSIASKWAACTLTLILIDPVVRYCTVCIGG